MNDYLTRLGIPLEIQAFFKTDQEICFDYGDSHEHFGDSFHYVPASGNLWLAGEETAPEVIITHSAMEAMAFLTVNRMRYPKPQQSLFVAIGSRLNDQQSDWIRKSLRKRKFTLVFGNDLTGHVMDIKLTAAIRNLKVRVFYEHHQVKIEKRQRVKVFNDEELTLHHFRLAFGIRANVRTRKPAQYLTFLDQLKHDINR